MDSVKILEDEINSLFRSGINEELIGKFKKGLSHYTNSGAAINIIENNVLWSSNAGFLNDPNDCVSLIREFCDFIYLELIKTSLADSVVRLKRRIDEGLYDAGDYLPGVVCDIKENFLYGLYTIVYGRHKKLFRLENDECNKFIISFTMNDEDRDLPQWRSYGDNGSGVRIRFDTKELHNIASKFSENEKVALSGIYPCLYFKKNDYKEFSSNVIRVCLDFVDKNSGINLIEVFTSVASSIELNSLLVKDYYYESENEARWVLFLKRDSYDLVKFRNNKDGIVSYVPLVFDKKAIKEIVCGPLMSDRGMSSLKLFSRLQLNEGVLVSRSKITFVG